MPTLPPGDGDNQVPTVPRDAAELRAIRALLREGLTPEQIAAVLKISLRTYYRRARRLSELSAVALSFAACAR